MRSSSLYRRSRRSVMVPPGTETLEVEWYRVRWQEQYLAFAALQEQLDYTVAVLSQSAYDIVPEQCDDLDLVFQNVLSVVQGALAALELPDMELGARPYPLLLKLWSLHRTLIEVQVLVNNVRALCEQGRLAKDFTGSYGHLRHYLAVVLRGSRELMTLLGVEEVPPVQVSVQANTSFRQFSAAAASA